MTFGFVITTLIKKKGFLISYIETFGRLNDDIVFPTPIKLSDVQKMKITFDDSVNPENFQTKKKRKMIEDRGKGKEKEADFPRPPKVRRLISPAGKIIKVLDQVTQQPIMPALKITYG